MRPTRRAVAVAAVTVLVGGLAVACEDDPVERALPPEVCVARTDDGEISLDPEQAEIATTIVAVAIRRGLGHRAVTIALATAEQESKLRNLDYGDRDSLGVFQQRPSQGWGTAEQIQDPAYATRRFFAALEKIDGWQQMPLHKAAQRVQRSAYPRAYADHEPKATILTTALTGRAGSAGFSCLLRPSPVTSDVDAARAAVRHDWGRREVPAVSATDGGFVVRLASAAPSRRTLALSYWLMARAHTLGLGSVRSAGKQWRANDENHTWRDATVDEPQGQVTAQLLPKPTPTAT